MLEDRVRSGVAGAWDRLVGPSASAVENAGAVGLAVAGLGWGAVARVGAPAARRRVAVGLLAADLWGGAWVNNTPSSVAWYERSGQGARQHLGFAAVHVLHPAVVASVDTLAGHRSRSSAGRWAGAHYAWMMAAATGIAAAPRRARLPLAVGATAVGLVVDRRLGPSRSARWFAPVYYVKLLVGHAAGSVWHRH